MLKVSEKPISAHLGRKKRLHSDWLSRSPSGGQVASSRTGAEGSEGVPSGHSASRCIGGCMQDYGPGQGLLNATDTFTSYN